MMHLIDTYIHTEIANMTTYEMIFYDDRDLVRDLVIIKRTTKRNSDGTLEVMK